MSADSERVRFEPDEGPRTGGGHVVVTREWRIYFDPRLGESLGEAVDRCLRVAEEK